MTAPPEVRKLGARLTAIETELRAQSTSARLGHSSIENAALPVMDADGTERSSWGVQADGTVATVYTNGPTPGAPAAPTLTAHQLAVVVQWDGTFETGSAPLDLAHVEVHVSETVDELGKFTPSPATLVGTLAPTGGALTFAGDNDVHYVCLVAQTTSRKQSEPSDYLSVTPLPADVVLADELVGKIVTGGIVRTAADGPRVELNATVDEQSVRFIGSRGDVATITQSDATSGGTVIGTGVALMSSPGDNGLLGAVLLMPGTVGITATEADTGTNRAQIQASEGYAALAAGPNGYEQTIWVDDAGANLQSPAGTISTGVNGLLLNDQYSNHFWCTPEGTWRLRGAGDVGGATGGIFRVSEKDRLDYFLEMDANEIQTNPYGESLHLNLDSKADVTFSGLMRVRAFPSSPEYGQLAGYAASNPSRPASLVFATALQSRERDGSGYTPIWHSGSVNQSNIAEKADVEPLDTAALLDEVTTTGAYRYRYVPEYLAGADVEHRGLMALDVPDAARRMNEDGDEGVDLYALLATVWGAVQELSQRVEALRA